MAAVIAQLHSRRPPSSSSHPIPVQCSPPTTSYPPAGWAHNVLLPKLRLQVLHLPGPHTLPRQYPPAGWAPQCPSTQTAAPGPAPATRCARRAASRSRALPPGPRPAAGPAGKGNGRADRSVVEVVTGTGAVPWLQRSAGAACSPSWRRRPSAQHAPHSTHPPTAASRQPHHRAEPVGQLAPRPARNDVHNITGVRRQVRQHAAVSGWMDGSTRVRRRVGVVRPDQPCTDSQPASQERAAACLCGAQPGAIRGQNSSTHLSTSWLGLLLMVFWATSVPSWSSRNTRLLALHDERGVRRGGREG